MTRLQFLLCLIGVFFSSRLYSDPWEEAREKRWNKATRVGFYEKELTYSDTYSSRKLSENVKVGNEYLLWGETANIVLVTGSDSCIIMFHDTLETFLLLGYPTEDFYDQMDICLVSPVKCTGISNRNMRILEVMSTKEAKDFFRRMEQEKEAERLSFAGFRTWELKTGETFFARYDKSVGGYAIFELTDGTIIKYKPKELSEDDIVIYKKKYKSLQNNKRRSKK